MKKKIDPFEKPLSFAREKHKGQMYGDYPFIIHPLNVLAIIELVEPKDTPLQIAAILHDTLEDTNTTFAELEKAFGVDVAYLVREVTKNNYNTFPALQSRRAVILKFADRLSNLVNMTEWDKERQETYIKKSCFWKS